MSNDRYDDSCSTFPYIYSPEESLGRFRTAGARLPHTTSGLFGQGLANSGSRRGTSKYGNSTLPTRYLKPEQGFFCPWMLRNPHLPPKSDTCWTERFRNTENVRAHLEQDHGLQTRLLQKGLTEVQQFESLWHELFPSYQGEIPSPYGWSRDDFRRQQNLMIIEMYERHIQARLMLSEKVIGHDELQHTLDEFRTKSAKRLLPSSCDPAKSGADVSTLASARLPYGYQLAEFEAPSISPFVQLLTTERTGESQRSPSPEDSHSPEPIATIVEAFTTTMKRTMVDRMMDWLRETADSGTSTNDEEEEESSTDTDVSKPETLPNGRGCSYGNTTQGSPDDAGGGSRQAARHSSSQDSGNVSTTISGSSKQSGKRKARDQSASGDSGRGGGKRHKPTAPADQECAKPSRKFACPYFKHSPEKPDRATSCCYPGFTSVSRVKEHIYRIHGPLNQCPNCFMGFDDEDTLGQHIRAEERCIKQNEKPKTENLTVRQERKLHTRKNKDICEEERWKHIYRLLFDLGDDSETPSPYCEQASSKFQLLERFERFSRDNLPQLLQSEFMQMVESDTQVLEALARLQGQVVGVAQRCHATLFRRFRESEQGPSLNPQDQDPEAAQLDISPRTSPESGQGGAVTGAGHTFDLPDIPEILWDFQYGSFESNTFMQ